MQHAIPAGTGPRLQDTRTGGIRVDPAGDHPGPVGSRRTGRREPDRHGPRGEPHHDRQCAEAPRRRGIRPPDAPQGSRRRAAGSGRRARDLSDARGARSVGRRRGRGAHPGGAAQRRGAAAARRAAAGDPRAQNRGPGVSPARPDGGGHAAPRAAPRKPRRSMRILSLPPARSQPAIGARSGRPRRVARAPRPPGSRRRRRLHARSHPGRHAYGARDARAARRRGYGPGGAVMAGDTRVRGRPAFGRRRFLGRAALAAGGALLGAARRPVRAAYAAAPAGELRVSLPARIVGLDPMGAQAAEESVRVVSAHIFDTLVVHDPRTRGYRPALAVKWETPDPATWVFTLRPGVRFHDGGALTARDVKASLERMIAQKGPFAPLWAAIDSVDAPADAAVRIKTKTPVGTMLANLSLLSILPAAAMNNAGFFNRPVGSGPFRVASYRPDSELVLDANPGYWGPAPGVKTLRFRDIPEIAARVTALITGEIDLTYGLPPDQLATLRGNKDLHLQTTPSYRYYFIWMNVRRSPFTDKRVRQAMIYALDTQTMLTALLKGIARPMTAPIPSTVFGYAPQRPYGYDPARAKQLLAAAGHPGGFDTSMIWNPGSGPQ